MLRYDHIHIAAMIKWHRSRSREQILAFLMFTCSRTRTCGTRVYYTVLYYIRAVVLTSLLSANVHRLQPHLNGKRSVDHDVNKAAAIHIVKSRLAAHSGV